MIFPIRLNKFLSISGVGSRRFSETFIFEGKVSVNGSLVKEPAYMVQEKDVVTLLSGTLKTFNAKALLAYHKPQIWCYYKPKGVIVSESDPQGRPTVFSEIKKSNPSLPRLISVGRLDLNSEGLLLLSNDGELARHLEHPSNQYKRSYRVRIFGAPTLEDLKKMREGITIDEINYAPIDVEWDGGKGAQNNWLFMSLMEGKNREIRKIMEHFGYAVSRLVRVSFGPFEIGSLKPGEIRSASLKDLHKFQNKKDSVKLTNRT